MGMQYDVVYHDAIIKPERYGDLIGWTPEQLAADPSGAAVLALKAIREILGGEGDVSEITADGLKIDGCSFTTSASYSWQGELDSLLALCEPGAWTMEIDAEESTGNSWIKKVMPDGELKTFDGTTVYPGHDWPDNFDALVATLRLAIAEAWNDPPTNVERAARALVDVLPKAPEPRIDVTR